MTILNENKSVFLNIIRSGIAVGIIYYLLNKYLFADVLSYVSLANLNYFASAGVLSIIFQMLVSSRLKLLAEQQEIPISLYDAFKINLMAAFYGLFLPAKNMAGGAIRFYELSKVNNKKAEAFASIILDRSFATIALCLVGASFWLMDKSNTSSNFGYSFIFATSIVFAILLSGIFILKPLAKIFGILKFRSFGTGLAKFYDSLKNYRNVSSKSLIFIFSLSLLVHFLEVLVYYLLAKSQGLNISVFAIGWIRSVAILATMIPITISGLGIREGMFIFLLKPYGVRGEEAFALSILIFFATILLVGIIGGIYEVNKMISTVAKCRDIKKREM